MLNILIISLISITACNSPQNTNWEEKKQDIITKAMDGKVNKLHTGASKTEAYFPLLEGKKVACVVNQTSTIGDVHLVDSLLGAGIQIVKVFAPEHGFRGDADAGEHVADQKDKKTGLPIISLYGKNRKPSPEMLEGIDVIIFDIQDVGVRFYTYISTMSYIMDALGGSDILFLVLDRPNPNGHFIDGPILEPAYSSFVGLHPVPIVHGMTVGEYALMKNAEWVEEKPCNLKVIAMDNYDHKMRYELPIKPSPNLPNIHSILLYPSLCLFEGTTVSVGRGTDKQFQIFGHPEIKSGSFLFTPEPFPGAKHPKLEGVTCYGRNLSSVPLDNLYLKQKVDLNFLVATYKELGDKMFLENNFFNKLAGNNTLMQQIKAGKTDREIRATWSDGLAKFKEMRKKYLLYPDF